MCKYLIKLLLKMDQRNWMMDLGKQYTQNNRSRFHYNDIYIYIYIYIWIPRRSFQGRDTPKFLDGGEE
jgi:hypothetical protein